MDRVKEVLLIALLISGLLFWALIFITVGNYLPRERVYDCSLAEISPDYPREVVDQCRRLKSGRSIST